LSGVLANSFLTSRVDSESMFLEDALTMDH
jgi:hypothetical protein